MWLIGIIVKNTSETVIFCKNEPRKQFTCAPVERTVTFTADSLPGSPCFDGRALLLFNGRAQSCLLIFTGSLQREIFTSSHVCLSTICANVFIDYYYGHYISGEFQSAFFISTYHLTHLVSTKNSSVCLFHFCFVKLLGSFKPIICCFHDVF